MSTYHHPLTIRAGDTDVIEIPVSPSWALEGARVRAKLWLGKINAPPWAHSWDTIDGVGIEIVGGTIRLSTGGADWLSAPRDRTLEMVLEVELSRGGSVQTLPHYPVRVLPQAILTPPTPPEPSPPIDGTLTEVWVDGDAGSDLAAGTEDDPVRTLARAIELVTDEEVGAVYLRPSSEPYDGAVLGRPLGRRFGLEIVAPGEWTEVAPPWTVSADSTTVEIGAPGATWAPNEWLSTGATLEVVSSSNPAIVGARRTIVQSTADRVWVSVALEDMPAGTTCRIVTPGVTLDVSDGLHLGEGPAYLALFGLELVVSDLSHLQRSWHGTGVIHGCRVAGWVNVYPGRFWTGAGYGYRFDPATYRYGGLGLSVVGELFVVGGNQVSGTFAAHRLAIGSTWLDVHGLGVSGLSGGAYDLELSRGASGSLGRTALVPGAAKTPIWLGRRTHITGGSHVDLRTTAHLPDGGELRVDGSRLSVSSPDRIVTTGTIRAQAGGVVRLQGATAIASPPGGGYIVGEQSFQLAVPDLDDSSLDPKGRLVSPVDGSRIYWAAPEPV